MEDKIKGLVGICPRHPLSAYELGQNAALMWLHGFCLSWIASQLALGTSRASPGLSAHVWVDPFCLNDVKSMLVGALEGPSCL